MQQPGPVVQSEPGSEKPAQPPPEKKPPSGRMPIAGSQALGLWMTHVQLR
jgi:hypothetical protein